MSRNRIKNYTIKGQEIIIPKATTIEDIRLIINETKGAVICSSMQKDNVTLTTITDPIAGTTETSIGVDASICELSSTDKLTIECDYGDDLSSVENKVEEVKQAVNNIDLSPIETKVDDGVAALSKKIDNIDLSAVENKVQEESAAIQEKIDNIDLSSVAKQGENQEATNTKIYEEVQKISAVNSDVVQGKQKVAAAITLKGVDAGFNESLADLALKINQISQKQYISIGDDRYYYPQPHMQSIFVVAEDLKKNDMPEYIPAYMKEYKQLFGINQFVIVDYYQEDIVLEEAAGALTSDGYFYLKTTNGYRITLPNGDVESYEVDSITHHFNNNNGVINYWCAYFFANEGYNFNAKGNYLMNIIVCGKCNSLDIYPYSYVYVDGEVSDVVCSMAAKSNSVSLVNFISHSNGKGIVIANQHCTDIKLLDLTTISNSTIVDFGMFETNGMQGLKFLSCPNLKEIKNAGSIFSLDGFTNLTTKNIFLWSLKKIQFEELENVDNSSFIFNGKDSGGYARQHALYDVEEINLPKLKECSVLFKAWYNQQANVFWWFHNLKKLRLPSLKKVGATIFTQPIQGCYVDTSSNTVTSSPYNYIELVDYSSATEIGNNLGGICASHTKLDNLVDFRVGALEKSINTQYWTAANVIADETKKAQLQQNIHNYIAERVSDRTGMSALTFTFSQAVRNILLPETETLFAAKNWNIAPTRTS